MLLAIRIVLAPVGPYPVEGLALALASVAVASMLLPTNLRLPSRARQVKPGLAGRYPLWFAAWIWGAELGMGFATYLVTPGVYGVAAIGLLLRPWQTVVVTAAYGVTRTIAIAAAANLGATSDPGVATRWSWQRWPVALATRARVPMAMLVSITTVFAISR